MTSYKEITEQIGDQWVAALKRAEENLGSFVAGVQESRSKIDVPTPESITKLTESFQEGLPKPSEVVEANFELTNRLLAAQRDLTLRLLEASSAKGESAPAKPAAKKS
ncbi:hypothetical protein BN12_1200016 [Nostocoides japonicum T1-X7]|uniref:Uncharacterized protein n=1 Tax=Nostocoides japonicum T1-X7 TaxID=1194083 RepID=A0A077LUL3_9MICO|nr:hypothetical protein [Tetrasphaera japonica]CCH76362.1 hypothetical protein BN12_1200016 [Tetrasphaera japonica T1-X7]